MSANPSQLMLPQSATTVAKTPPPASSTRTTTKESKLPNKRLELYNSLFGEGGNKTCEQTGLQLTQSLNYSLHTFLHLSDTNWVLAVIDVDSFDNIQEKYGEQNATRKIVQIGHVIKSFCDNDPRKLKGFKCNDLVGVDPLQEESIHDIFALLMYCHPKIVKSEKYILKLISKIQQQTNESVCAGIAKMNSWESFQEWKQRAFKNLQNVQNTFGTSTNNLFYSDIHVKYVNAKKETLVANVDQKQDEKQQQQRPVAKLKLGNKEEFDQKMQEISNNEDYEWISAIMAIDDWKSFEFLNNYNKQAVKQEMDKMEQEMFHLFDIYGNGTTKNEFKYFGYRLNSNNGEFGLILYDSKDISKCFVAAHEILETLKEEISMKCKFTVSIGSSRLIEDDLGIMDDWIERIKSNLKRAQKGGKNEICFGTTNGNDDDDEKENDNVADMELKIEDDIEADKIEKESLQVIKVCCMIVLYFPAVRHVHILEFFSCLVLFCSGYRNMVLLLLLIYQK